MQNRMKTHKLSQEEIDSLLERVETGNLATINSDGTPYITPIHFIYQEDKIFFHGLPKGKKLDNISMDSRVSFSIYEMDSYILDVDGKPCDTNTKYRSVIISGNAKILDNRDEKTIVLKRIVKKYTPNLENKVIPDNMIDGTAVIEIEVKEISGKYYL